MTRSPSTVPSYRLRCVTLHVLRQRFGIDREAVILRRDFDLSGLQEFHRMIRAAMPELQLERLSAERQTENLMTETDAEDRLVGLRQVARVLDGVVDRRRIARAVAQENAVHARGEHLFRRRRRGKHVHLTAVGHQAPEDVPLDAEVVRADAQRPLRMRLRRQRKIRAHFREILCDVGGPDETAPRT